MYENSSIEYREKGYIHINLDSKIVSVDLKTLEVECEEDEHIKSIITTVIKQLKSLS